MQLLPLLQDWNALVDFHSRLFYICAPAPTDCFQIAVIADGQNQQQCRIRNNDDEAAIGAAVDFTNFQDGFLTNCRKIFQNQTLTVYLAKYLVIQEKNPKREVPNNGPLFIQECMKGDIWGRIIYFWLKRLQQFTKEFFIWQTHSPRNFLYDKLILRCKTCFYKRLELISNQYDHLKVIWIFFWMCLTAPTSWCG